MEERAYAHSPRISVAMPEDMIERLKTLGKNLGVSYAKVVESLLYLDDETIARHVEAAKPLIAAAKKQRLYTKREEARKASAWLRKLTPEQLAAVQKMAEGSN